MLNQYGTKVFSIYKQQPIYNNEIIEIHFLEYGFNKYYEKPQETCLIQTIKFIYCSKVSSFFIPWVGRGSNPGGGYGGRFPQQFKEKKKCSNISNVAVVFPRTNQFLNTNHQPWLISIIDSLTFSWVPDSSQLQNKHRSVKLWIPINRSQVSGLSEYKSNILKNKGYLWIMFLFPKILVA